MSKTDTRAGLHDALAAHLAAQKDATASGQDPAGVDRSGIEAAARAHLAAAPGKEDAQAAYEDLHAQLAGNPEDAGLRAGESEAANLLASVVQAQRILEGRPVAAHVGG